MLQLVDIILCTHNPRADYLNETLRSLRKQSLPLQQWRFILVDNASSESLQKSIDISWHPNAIYIAEPNVGLINARIAGIQATTSDLIIFVDDDNVLAENYLEIAIKIAQNAPYLGSFGGKITGKFESLPPDWIIAESGVLAINNLNRSVWSNLYTWETCPAGAGMVIRSHIAKEYLHRIQNDPLRKKLGRKGNHLNGGEDLDMVFTGLDMGYGSGCFTDLSLVHLIPSRRMTKSYILRLHEGIEFSQVVLESFREHKTVKLRKWYEHFALSLYRLMLKSYFEFQKGVSKYRGIRRAVKFLKDYNH
jgi:glycosyltransferase involved in cell wall biosynthesis